MTDHSNKTGQTHKTGQDTQQDSYTRAKDSAADAVRRASQGIESNPLAVVAGGIAVGVIAGALLPRSDKEKELLAPVGKRLGDTARQAFAAAREAGTQELDGAGLTPGAARDRGKELLGGISKALSSAGAAAAQAAKEGSATKDKPAQTDKGSSSGQGSDNAGGFAALSEVTPTQA